MLLVLMHIMPCKECHKMYQPLIDKIETYDIIVIHRHIQPDLDALGSQLGLKRLIQLNYPNKEVYTFGEMGDFKWFGSMDQHIPEQDLKKALAIVLDVSGKERVSDQRFLTAKESVVVDHHQNDTDFADTFISDPTQIATCQMLTEMAVNHHLTMDQAAATYLLGGLVTDSGRFMYPQTTDKTFECAAYLMKQGADLQYLYHNLYEVDYTMKRLKGYFIYSFKTTEHHVAYMKNPKSLKDEFGVSTFTVSRGMVNQMAGIKHIPIWANFTETDSGAILCELRSKHIPIVDVAKKYGGGGHDLACGCTAIDWETTDDIIRDLDLLAKKGR